MNLIALGINHNSAAVEVRERVAFAPEQVTEALGDACEQGGVEEVVILSTCNRTEMYAIVPQGVDAADKVPRADRLDGQLPPPLSRGAAPLGLPL